MQPRRVCPIRSITPAWPHVDILLFLILYLQKLKETSFLPPEIRLRSSRIIFKKIQSRRASLTSKLFLRHDMPAAQIGYKDGSGCDPGSHAQHPAGAQAIEPFLSRFHDPHRQIIDGA